MPVKTDEKPKAVEPVLAAAEEVTKAPAETASAEITEPVEETKAEIEAPKASEPEVCHVDEPVAVTQEQL